MTQHERANKLLALREDLYEMHFHQVDREWLVEAMVDFAQQLPQQVTENTSDGYHTFKELYDFRKAYNVALFNEWGKFDIPYYDVHKSWKHNDGELCFGGGWFIVVAVLPTGQISNHYEAKDWDLFKIPEVEKAKYPFDGHTGQDVINRLISIQETFKGGEIETFKQENLYTEEQVQKMIDDALINYEIGWSDRKKQFSLYEHKETITSADTPISKTFLDSIPKQETLYTEEQVMQAYEYGSNASLGVSKTNLIQSLKQSKKD